MKLSSAVQGFKILRLGYYWFFVMAIYNRPLPTIRPFIISVDEDIEDSFLLKSAFAAADLVVDLQSYHSLAELEAYLNCDDNSKIRLPKIIIVDMRFPGVMANQTIVTLKAHPYCRRIPIIMLSGMDDLQAINEFYDIGGSAFIKKPTSLENWKMIVTILWEYWFVVTTLST